MAIVSFFLLRASATGRRVTALVRAATIGAPRPTRAVLAAPTTSTSSVATSMCIGAIATTGIRFARFQNKGEAAFDLFDSFNLFKRSIKSSASLREAVDFF